MRHAKVFLISYAYREFSVILINLNHIFPLNSIKMNELHYQPMPFRNFPENFLGNILLTLTYIFDITLLCKILLKIPEEILSLT